MARPLAFERKMALEMAMQVFWSQGYFGTSINDLVEAMGISKSSLYGSFGNKRAIFLECIEFYSDNVAKKVRSAADVPGAARQVIRSVMRRAVDRILDAEGKRGCFLNNSAVEMGPRELEAAARCRSGIKLMEDTFECLVRRGQTEGDISMTRDPKKIARFLTSAINGIMVIGKVNPSRETLYDIVETTMEVVS